MALNRRAALFERSGSTPQPPQVRTIASMARQTPLKVGDKAPLFTLPSTLGEPISLADCLEKGPVVLAWYLFDFGRV